MVCQVRIWRNENITIMDPPALVWSATRRSLLGATPVPQVTDLRRAKKATCGERKGRPAQCWRRPVVYIDAVAAVVVHLVLERLAPRVAKVSELGVPVLLHPSPHPKRRR